MGQQNGPDHPAAGCPQRATEAVNPRAHAESFFTTDWFFYAAEEWNDGARVADVLLLMDLNRMSNRALAQEMDVAEAIKRFRLEAARSQEKARPR